MDDECALMGHAGERLGHQLRHIPAEGADYVKRRLCRIHERTHDIENRPHAECRANRSDRLHCRMESRREQKREPVLPK